MATDTVGRRLYPVPDLHDVELRLLADRLIVAGVPSQTVKALRVTDLVKLAQEAARITGEDGGQR